MRKRNFLLVVFLSLIVIIIALLLNYQLTKQSETCFKNYCFKVELAKTPEERSRGLMSIKSLASDKGMLFIFEKEGIFPFWMKNTLIPLDIIWINEEEKSCFYQ